MEAEAGRSLPPAEPAITVRQRESIAFCNFPGPLLLGRFFDTVGRRPMIEGTYILSGLSLFGTAWPFGAGSLTAVTMTGCWCLVLFVASAGASSAYLT